MDSRHTSDEFAPTSERPRRGASSTAPAWTGLFARPWFWVLGIGTLWFLPLLKSLGGRYPEPVPGHETAPIVFRLIEEGGRQVSNADLEGHILLVQQLDLSDAQRAGDGFDAFRRRKKRLRGLGSLLVHLLLVRDGDARTLGMLLDEKRGRKPNNLYLFDPNGELWDELLERALSPGAQALVLDRHARLRGAYGGSEAEGDRMARDLASLANWPGSDPPPGQAVRR